METKVDVKPQVETHIWDIGMIFVGLRLGEGWGYGHPCPPVKVYRTVSRLDLW